MPVPETSPTTSPRQPQSTPRATTAGASGSTWSQRLLSTLRGASFAEGLAALRPSGPPPPDDVPDVPTDVGGKATRYALASGILERKGLLAPGARDPRSVAQLAVEHGILKGAGGPRTTAGLIQSLRLAEPVTRAEAAAMVVRAFGIAELGTGEVRRTFKDLSPFHWAGPSVYGAVVAGVLRGYADETFRPGDPLDAQHLEGFLDNAAAPPGQPASFDPRREWGSRPVLEGGATGGTNYSRSLDPAAHTTRDQSASQTDRVAAANGIVDQLDASNSRRYQPTRRNDKLQTYCNVFGHDYAFLMGAFVPRMWWSYSRAQLEEFEKNGEFPAPVYGQNTYEMNANALHDWFSEWGHRFGWSLLGVPEGDTLGSAQDLANQGRVVIMTGDTGSGTPGHITAIVPETATAKAVRDEEGRVVRPLQSEAGADPKTRGTSDWFEARGYYKGGRAIWVHG